VENIESRCCLMGGDGFFIQPDKVMIEPDAIMMKPDMVMM
jgi:hypothetical protein